MLRASGLSGDSLSLYGGFPTLSVPVKDNGKEHGSYHLGFKVDT